MASMKIDNKLNKSDFLKIKEALDDDSINTIELLKEINHGFVEVAPLTIAPSGKGYVVQTRIVFDDPIGNTVCLNTNIKEIGIKKSTSRINLELRKPIVDDEEIEKDITYGLSLIEKVVNYSCEIRSEECSDNFIVDSKFVERQIEKSKREKDVELRNEKLEPFAVVHADSGFELRVQSLNLVPVYEEYDRFSLYGGKKAFILLPRSFAMKLLTCEQNSLIPEEQFSENERKVLNDYVKKKYIRSAKVAGKTCYFALDENTRTYLIKALRTNT